MLADLHRATTVLTKQVRRLLAGDHRLGAIRDTVTDPDRTAMPDGRTASALCGDAWSAVRSVAEDRSAAAVDGAEASANPPSCDSPPRGRRCRPTRGGAPAVDRSRRPLGARSHDGRRITASLLHSPETADDEILVASSTGEASKVEDGGVMSESTRSVTLTDATTSVLLDCVEDTILVLRRT